MGMQSDIVIYLRAILIVCIPVGVALLFYFPLRFLQRSRSEFFTAVGLFSFLGLLLMWIVTQQKAGFVVFIEAAAFFLSLSAVITFFHIQSRWLHAVVAANSFLPPTIQSRHLHLRHLIQIGIILEERGATFYRGCLERALDGPAKKLFQTLMNDEMRHKAVLQTMLSRWLALGMKENIIHFLEEKIAGLRLFTDPPVPTAKQSEVIRYALTQEEKMEQFYRSFEKDFPDAYRREYLMRLVDEEQSHQRQLKRISNTLSDTA